MQFYPRFYGFEDHIHAFVTFCDSLPSHSHLFSSNYSVKPPVKIQNSSRMARVIALMFDQLQGSPMAQQQ